MLKTVSSIANAIGALNYKGTWDANANSPVLTSSVGTKGDYYVVGTAGTTALNGISNWGIGDWAVFNGSVWQRVEGGADLNGVNLSVSGTSQLTGNATFSDNITQGTAAKGVNFTANANAPGMTSELLNWYEEGTFTPVVAGSGTAGTYQLSANTSCTYQRTGNLVTIMARIVAAAVVTGGGTGNIRISGLPFNMSATVYGSPFSAVCSGMAFTGSFLAAERVTGGSTATVYPYGIDNAGTQTQVPIGNFVANSIVAFQFQYRV